MDEFAKQDSRYFSRSQIEFSPRASNRHLEFDNSSDFWGDSKGSSNNLRRRGSTHLRKLKSFSEVAKDVTDLQQLAWYDRIACGELIFHTQKITAECKYRDNKDPACLEMSKLRLNLTQQAHIPSSSRSVHGRKRKPMFVRSLVIALDKCQVDRMLGKHIILGLPYTKLKMETANELKLLGRDPEELPVQYTFHMDFKESGGGSDKPVKVSTNASDYSFLRDIINIYLDQDSTQGEWHFEDEVVETPQAARGLRRVVLKTAPDMKYENGSIQSSWKFQPQLEVTGAATPRLSFFLRRVGGVEVDNETGVIAVFPQSTYDYVIVLLGDFLLSLSKVSRYIDDKMESKRPKYDDEIE
jgi:hypothetical protein